MHSFNLNINSEKKPVERYWELLVGSCHAATALREDYRAQLKLCRHELGFRYVRFHGLFNDDMSVAKKPFLSEDIVLSFTNIDSIFDFLLSIGMKPFIEIGFMPECFASGNQTIFHYKGNVTPPSDYDDWSDFIKTFTEHLIERYGRDEVRQWFFEVWNEPNLGGETGLAGAAFWAGDMDEYFKLYKSTVLAIKSVDSALPVGGPATSNNAWISEMLEFCEKDNVPIDFITTHHYPTDVVLGYGVEDSHNFIERLRKTDKDDKKSLFKLASEYIVFQEHLWEKVPRGVLTDMAKRAVSEAKGLPVYYTEWSSLSGLSSDGPFGASFIAKTVMDNIGLVKGYSYWTFSDIFEEHGMPYKAFSGSFGLLTLQGIRKAPYRVYQLLHMLGNERYSSVYSNSTVDIYAFYKKESRCVQLLAVNHNSLLHDISDENIEIVLEGASFSNELYCDLYRVDENNANALAVWQEMGSPSYLTQEQIDLLNAASALKRESIKLVYDSGAAKLNLDLPAMGTALISIYI